MGNDNTSSGQKVDHVRIIEKVSTLKLENDLEPKLSEALNARGHDIEDAGDVQCKTINGETIEEILTPTLKVLTKEINSKAQAKHAHPEFEALRLLISTKADVSHSHPSVPHTHSLERLDGVLPLSKVEGGAKLSALLSKSLASSDHSHPDLSARLLKLEEALKSLPKPEKYDDSIVKRDISALQYAVKQEKPVNYSAEITVGPLPAPSITCEAAYLILSTNPENPEVTDSAGQKGTVKVTISGRKSLIRGIFPALPVQPLTFTFSSPPTLCGIGVSTENSAS